MTALSTAGSLGDRDRTTQTQRKTNHENTKGRNHEKTNRVAPTSSFRLFRGFVLSCFRDSVFAFSALLVSVSSVSLWFVSNGGDDGARGRRRPRPWSSRLAAAGRRRAARSRRSGRYCRRRPAP